MKPLDEFIKKNLDHFDTEEPLPGHFNRFDERLNVPEIKGSGKTIYLLMKIAAAIIVCAIITVAAFKEVRLLHSDLDQVFAAPEYPELIEAEHYYTSQLDAYYGKLQSLRFNNDKAEKKQVLNELAEMDKQVRSMKKDLKQNPDDERIVHAIINYYQVKLELMDMIITRTQEASNKIL